MHPGTAAGQIDCRASPSYRHGIGRRREGHRFHVERAVSQPPPLRPAQSHYGCNDVTRTLSVPASLIQSSSLVSD